MTDKKAKQYADKVEEHNYLSTYHAYQDGWTDSEPEKGTRWYIFMGMFFGAWLAVLVIVYLEGRGIYIIKP